MKYTTRQVKIPTSCICFDVAFCLLRGVLQALRQKYRKLSGRIFSLFTSVVGNNLGIPQGK